MDGFAMRAEVEVAAGRPRARHGCREEPLQGRTFHGDRYPRPRARAPETPARACRIARQRAASGCLDGSGRHFDSALLRRATLGANGFASVHRITSAVPSLRSGGRCRRRMGASSRTNWRSRAEGSRMMRRVTRCGLSCWRFRKSRPISPAGQVHLAPPMALALRAASPCSGSPAELSPASQGKRQHASS